MISPRETREHTIGSTPQGVLTVDGKEYPMAEALVATESVIQRNIKRVAKQLANDYMHLTHVDTHRKTTEVAPISHENPLIIISVLKGSYIFTADMVRYLGDYNLPHVVDFIRLASYKGTRSTGEIQLLSTPRFENLRGKHVLILEDIADSGYTLKYLKEKLQREHQPASLKICVLADKPGGRRVPLEPDYICLTVPNKYVIGYGFEVNDRYRNFRHIFTLKASEAKRYPSRL
ncbi:hypoxanthine-guanine phosphoribosyltransferase [Trypanosoma theileri]|uniref:Hypoxanthine-guanine phosphoribosyltransferase n=1 Tax=Trypanosoma theileri TaxID=67003 RepID=A0A1X0NZ92_9TRYP|nr:hypoxanthine-guanine phosphoribosyltransferase [Trypanosoma theileri]ORC89460.1 hypoxanthine-guanine phosphoribosyltransferase [Trypanosoma theileri]